MDACQLDLLLPPPAPLSPPTPPILNGVRRYLLHARLRSLSAREMLVEQPLQAAGWRRQRRGSTCVCARVHVGVCVSCVHVRVWAIGGGALQ